jgi:hypothetical protein
MSDSTSDLALRLDQLRFGIEKSLRYHQRRRAHYEGIHRYLMVGVLFSGSAAFADMLEQPQLFGLLGAAFGALDLVFSFSMRARDHELLHRRFTDIARQVETTATPTEDDLRRWTSARREIEADEPPVFWALEASCDNEVTIAWGRERHGLVRLTGWQKLFMHWWTFEKAEMPRAKPEHAAQAPASPITTIT